MYGQCVACAENKRLVEDSKCADCIRLGNKVMALRRQGYHVDVDTSRPFSIDAITVSIRSIRNG